MSSEWCATMDSTHEPVCQLVLGFATAESPTEIRHPYLPTQPRDTKTSQAQPNPAKLAQQTASFSLHQSEFIHQVTKTASLTLEDHEQEVPKYQRRDTRTSEP
uniref:WGS project CBMI000000000 data, contig CS3069_c001621 n=1 Tax=Fusarium clavum TaxID=2594811 RepID=A0A090MG17_9HYPO|nr:unnamed protein product [Fusarium clavum]